MQILIHITFSITLLKNSQATPSVLNRCSSVLLMSLLTGVCSVRLSAALRRQTSVLIFNFTVIGNLKPCSLCPWAPSDLSLKPRDLGSTYPEYPLGFMVAWYLSTVWLFTLIATGVKAWWMLSKTQNPSAAVITDSRTKFALGWTFPYFF